MNVLKYSAFRLVIGFFVIGGLFGWGGFVAMQDQVIEFYEKEPAYDITDDSSLQKYLGNGQSLNDSKYVPDDLVVIDSDFTANNARRFQMREEAAKQFADLAWNFWNENKGARLFITSTYRSSKFQESLLKKGCSRAKCAEAGSSEHQLGLAIDIGVMTKGGKYIALAKGNIYYQWLADNAPELGFHNTYQKGIDIDGQMEEGRHRRYLGDGLAKSLRDDDKTFAERYSLNKAQNYSF